MLLVMPLLIQANQQAKRYSVDIYGHIYNIEFASQPFLSIYHNLELSDYTLENLNQIVSDLENALLKTSLLVQFDKIASSHNMDDMAYLLMLKKFTNKVFHKRSTTFKSIFIYGILILKEKDVMLTYNSTELSLYGRTNIWIDNVLYVQLNNKFYFDLSFDQLAQPHQNHRKLVREVHFKPKPIIINHMSPPDFYAKMAKTNFPFEFDGSVFFFNTQVNKSLIEYYKELPPIEIGTIYLNYGLSSLAKASLIKEMIRATENMTEPQVLDFLLTFTQRAFNYQDDIKLYGVEKFSFPEETLLNYYSDCEDRAMLFATLVKEVLGMNSIALYYKSARHINIAVRSNEKYNVDHFVFNDNTYIVCEPTYDGYKLGQNFNKVKLATLIDW
jgi:hypothetical protein